MSCNINTSRVTSVFALGQWHPVAKGSFDIDAYEVVLDLGERHKDIYQMGEMYPDNPPYEQPKPVPGSIGEHWRFKNPQGCDACMWRCPETGGVVAMSILEVKAWRYDPE